MIKIRYFFHPFTLAYLPLLLQLLVWLSLDGDNHMGLVRNGSWWSHTWIGLAALFGLFGLSFGMMLPVSLLKLPKINVRTILWICIFATVTSTIAFLIYARNNIDLILMVITFDLPEGSHVSYLSTVRQDRIIGITSMTWLSMTAMAACSYLVAKKETHYKFMWLIFVLIFVVVITHSFVFSGRISAIYPIIALIFVYLASASMLNYRVSFKKALLVIALISIVFVMFFAATESLRNWSCLRGSGQDISLSFMLEYLAIPYLAKNHWNALEFIDHPHYGAITYGAVVFTRIITLLGFDLSMVKGPYLGQHGTVVLFGLYYHNFGPIIALLASFMTMAVYGYSYKLAVKRGLFIDIYVYAMLIPGLLSVCRYNYLGNTAIYSNVFLAAIIVLLFGFLKTACMKTKISYTSVMPHD